MIITTPNPTVSKEWIGTKDNPAATIAPSIIPINCAIQASNDCLKVFSMADIAPSIANTILEVADVVPTKDTAINARITAIADFKVLRPM